MQQKLSKSKQKREHRRLRRSSPKSWCLVYALKHEGQIHYVGQTRLLPQQRLKWHFKEIWKRQMHGWHMSPVMRWLESLGCEPQIEVLDRNGIWDISEAVWIDRCRRDGEPLKNVASVIAD